MSSLSIYSDIANALEANFDYSVEFEKREINSLFDTVNEGFLEKAYIAAERLIKAGCSDLRVIVVALYSSDVWLKEPGFETLLTQFHAWLAEKPAALLAPTAEQDYQAFFDMHLGWLLRKLQRKIEHLILKQSDDWKGFLNQYTQGTWHVLIQELEQLVSALSAIKAAGLLEGELKSLTAVMALKHTLSKVDVLGLQTASPDENSHHNQGGDHKNELEKGVQEKREQRKSEQDKSYQDKSEQEGHSVGDQNRALTAWPEGALEENQNVNPNDEPNETLPSNAQSVLAPGQTNGTEHFASVPELELEEEPFSYSAYPMRSLIEKLTCFQRLLVQNDYVKASIVANDIHALIQSFDPRQYLPDLFRSFMTGQIEHNEGLQQANMLIQQPEFQPLLDLYHSDWQTFIEQNLPFASEETFLDYEHAPEYSAQSSPLPRQDVGFPEGSPHHFKGFE